MTDRAYNGWKNHATWLVNIWTDGDETMREIANRRHEYSYHELKEYVIENYVHLDEVNGLEYDLMLSSLSDVDWREIAAHLLDEDYEGEDNEVQD